MDSTRAVSVIIPVFNAERYLPVCLESLTIQTMQDFEVIVVDDCSTDSSVAVAENFLERFGGRLKILMLDRNTGSGAVPRNEGLKFSRGEYIYFVDADDFLVADALAKLYNAAENFQADVVCMKRGFICDASDSLRTVDADWDKMPAQIDEPMLENFDIGERLEKFFRTGYNLAPWTKFLRRDFLIANDIIFPHMKISEDVLWTFEIICLAKNFLHVSTPLYIHRANLESISQSDKSPAEEIKFWLDPLKKGVDILDDFMSRVNFFGQNPNYRFDVTNFFVKMQLAGMLDALNKLENRKLYEIVHDKFSDDKHAALIANLLIFMNYYYRNKH